MLQFHAQMDATLGKLRQDLGADVDAKLDKLKRDFKQDVRVDVVADLKRV